MSYINSIDDYIDEIMVYVTENGLDESDYDLSKMSYDEILRLHNDIVENFGF